MNIWRSFLMSEGFIDLIKTKLTVLVGFTEEELKVFPEKLLDIPIANGLDKFLNSEVQPRDFISNFQNITSPKWITYEEFIQFRDLINILLDDNDISILYNNKFISIYPYNHSFSNIDLYYKSLYEDDDYQATPIDEAINSVYPSIHNINGEYFISIDDDLLSKFVQYGFYNIDKDLDDKDELDDVSFNYSFEYNGDPRAIVELNQFVDSHNKQIIAISSTITEEVLNVVKALSSYREDHSFYIYHPKQKKKIISREKEYQEILNKYWGYDSFLNLDIYTDTRKREASKISQAQIIDDIVTQMESSIEGATPRDIFVTSSTGAGKSVMFQVPSLYISKKYPDENPLTLVISPLIGLMNDQVENLNKREINNAKTINSGLTPTEKAVISQDIKDGKIDLLYISIETLINRSDIQDLIGDRRIGLFVVDEAHTITTWGRTFRVDYWYMGSYLNKLRKEHHFPIVTFTATAIMGGPDDMYGEIKKSLNLVSPIQYIGRVKKDNISINVKKIQDDEKKKSGNDAISIKHNATLTRIKQVVKNEKKMLIYFPTVSSLRHFSKYISGLSPDLEDKVTTYHGQLTPEDKQINFKAFKDGNSNIMLATKAFGMGIDIPDIQIVYHYAITGNLLDYIQEIGRVARKEGMNGLAMLDYLPNRDFNEYKQLRALSSTKKNQLIDVMDKILTLYKKSGNKRHLNIDIESFDYLFNKDDDDQTDDELEKKVKLALLTIENDFRDKLNYPPFVSRPGSVNSQDYVIANKELINQIESPRYRGYFSKISNLENSFYQAIYIFRTEDYWKKNFSTISYRQFKFFLAKRGDEIRRDPILRNLTFAIQYKVIFEPSVSEENITQKLDNIISNTEKSLRSFATSQSHFTIKEFKSKLSRTMSIKDRTAEKYASIILSTLVQLDSIKNTRSITRYDNDKYKITNNYEDLLELLKDSLNKLINKVAKHDKGPFTNYYLPRIYKSEETDYQNILLGFLETFGLLAFELNGGNKPSISLRINSIAQMQRFVENPNKYNNKILTDQYFTYLRALEMYKHLFSLEVDGENPKEKQQNYTNEFWRVVEDYFFGQIPSKVQHAIHKD